MRLYKFGVGILFASLLLNLAVADLYAAKKPRHQEDVYYYSPCWAPDSKHVVYIKEIRYYKLRYDWLAEITKSTQMATGRDYYICKMDIDTKREEIIRKFRIKEWYSASAKYKSGWRAAWINKEDKTIFGDDYLEAKFISAISVDNISGDILIVYKISELYLLRKDGSKVIEILKGRSNVSNPRWSPDGKQILYQIGKSIDGKYISELWLVNADGTNDHLLVDNASSGIWHPSGGKIRFNRKGDEEIYYTVSSGKKLSKRIGGGTFSINIDGTNCYRAKGDRYKAPNENYAAYMPEDYLSEGHKGDKRFWLSIKGKDKPILLAENVPYSSYFEWNKKGDRLVYITRKDKIDSLNILDIGNENKQAVLAKGAAGSISFKWNKTGNKLAYLTRENQQRFLYIIDINDMSKTKRDSKYHRSYIWSNSGKKICYRGKGNKLKVMNADGTNEIEFDGYFYGICWNEDDKKIMGVCKSTKKNYIQYYLFDLESSSKEMIYEFDTVYERVVKGVKKPFNRTYSAGTGVVLLLDDVFVTKLFSYNLKNKEFIKFKKKIYYSEKFLSPDKRAILNLDGSSGFRIINFRKPIDIELKGFSKKY